MSKVSTLGIGYANRATLLPWTFDFLNVEAGKITIHTPFDIPTAIAPTAIAIGRWKRVQEHQNDADYRYRGSHLNVVNNELMAFVLLFLLFL